MASYKSRTSGTLCAYLGPVLQKNFYSSFSKIWGWSISKHAQQFSVFKNKGNPSINLQGGYSLLISCQIILLGDCCRMSILLNTKNSNINGLEQVLTWMASYPNFGKFSEEYDGTMKRWHLNSQNSWTSRPMSGEAKSIKISFRHSCTIYYSSIYYQYPESNAGPCTHSFLAFRSRQFGTHEYIKQE